MTPAAHVVILLVLLHTSSVLGYSAGAPSWKCSTGADMMPSHAGIQDQNSLIPYELLPSSSVYSTGSILNITLRSTDGRNFVGCLIKAVDVAGTTMGTIVTPPVGYQSLACPSITGQGITHSSKDLKSTLIFRWIAPDISTGDVTFQATVVQDYSTFWSRRSLVVLKPDILVVETTAVTPLPQTTMFVSTSTSSPLTTTSSLSNQVTGTSNMLYSSNPNPTVTFVTPARLPNEWNDMFNIEEKSAGIQNAAFKTNTMPIQSEISTGKVNALITDEMASEINQRAGKTFSNAFVINDHTPTLNVESTTRASSRNMHTLTDSSTISARNLHDLTEPLTTSSINIHTSNNGVTTSSRSVPNLTDAHTTSSRNAHNLFERSTSSFRNAPSFLQVLTTSYRNTHTFVETSTKGSKISPNLVNTPTTSSRNKLNFVETPTTSSRYTPNLVETSTISSKNIPNLAETSTTSSRNVLKLVEPSTTYSKNIPTLTDTPITSSRTIHKFAETSTISSRSTPKDKASTTLSFQTPLISFENISPLNNINVSTNEQGIPSSLEINSTSSDDTAALQRTMLMTDADSNSTGKILDSERLPAQIIEAYTTPTHVSSSQPSLSTTTILKNATVDDENSTASKMIDNTNDNETLHDKVTEALHSKTYLVRSEQSGGNDTDFDIANTIESAASRQINISSTGRPLHVMDAELNALINPNLTTSDIPERDYIFQNDSIPTNQSELTKKETFRSIGHVVNIGIETGPTSHVAGISTTSSNATTSAYNMSSVTTGYVPIQSMHAIKHSDEEVLKTVNTLNASTPFREAIPIKIDSTASPKSIETATKVGLQEEKATANILLQRMRTEARQKVVSRATSKRNTLQTAERLTKAAHTKAVSTFTKSSNPARSGDKKDKGNMIEYDTDCGYNKGCFLNCNGVNCQYLVTWQDRGNAVRFTIQGKPDPSPEVWVAVGFSSDTRMEDDSVTECVYSNGIVQAFNSYNPSSYNRRLNPAQLGLTLLQGSFLNGVFRCTFDRVKSVPNEPEMFDLNSDWHIMFAHGPATQLPAWGMRRHSITDLPPVSASRVDFQSFDIIGGSMVKYTLVKAHGCLMILAWVLFTGIGVVAARYYKNVWADKTLFKIKIWFQIHRASMVCTLLFNVIAFIVIFVEAEGYSEIPEMPGKTYLRSHPVLGIIITILCVSNPVMAIFRPGPDSKKRPIFNWAHWGVGMTAYILSAICICFGFQLGKSSTPDYAVYIMIVYVLYIIIFDVLFEVLDCMDRKQQKVKIDTVEMSDRNGTDNGHANGNGTIEPKEKIKRNDRVKTVLLALHVAFTAAFALVLILVVALN